MKNLLNYGVQEMNAEEKVNVIGGLFWGKAYSNAHQEGGYWVHTVKVYRFGICVNTYTEQFTPGNCQL